MTNGTRVVMIALGATLACATASGAYGLVDALSFVSGRQDAPEVKLWKPAQAALSIVPADASFGFFAPQVCAEFRLRARVGYSDGRPVADVVQRLGPESEMLVSSLSVSAQRDESARAIAASFASYALTRYPGSRYVEVRVEAEELPALVDASKKPSWVEIGRYLYRR